MSAQAGPRPRDGAAGQHLRAAVADQARGAARLTRLCSLVAYSQSKQTRKYIEIQVYPTFPENMQFLPSSAYTNLLLSSSILSYASSHLESPKWSRGALLPNPTIPSHFQLRISNGARPRRSRLGLARSGHTTAAYRDIRPAAALPPRQRARARPRRRTHTAVPIQCGPASPTAPTSRPARC